MKANSKLTQEPCCPKPMMLVGAGQLTSAIWKLGNEESGWRYRFNMVRQSVPSGCVTDLFQPMDLICFIKLIQLLAAEIANDGCLTHNERLMLRNLAQRLDEFVGGAADAPDAEAIPATIDNSQDDHSKGTQHGHAAHT